MSAMAQRWVALYLVLLLILAFIGVNSQTFYSLHDNRISQKADLLLERTDKRSAATHLTNPEEVRQWALRHGMVSSISIENRLIVAPSPPPSLAELEQGVMEIQTQWR